VSGIPVQDKGGVQAPPLIEMRGVSKYFGGIRALTDVDFTLLPGEIHGLVGENGAGKSTMMKIIAGVHTDFEGQMLVEGRPAQYRSARDSLASGIGMVHQELSVVADLTVAENVFLGVQPTKAGGIIDWSMMHTKARKLVGSLGLDLDPGVRMGSLPVGVQQLVELSRVLFSGARTIILDEPTSALSPPEVERLFAALRRLKAEGKGLVFISHFLDDVLEISDRITVFRNSKRVITENRSDLDKDKIISHMIGKGSIDMHMGEVTTLTGSNDNPVIYAAEGLSDGRYLKDVTLFLRKGEITGVYGFMGCGQIELARALFGRHQTKLGRTIIEGKPIRLRSTAAARRAGLAFVPENRAMMLFRSEPVFKNVSIAILERIHKWLLKPQQERAITKEHITDLQIRPPLTDINLGSLSGGNQQKVALAKWLSRMPKVLILSEPTRGMDVGAKEDVIRIVKSLRDKGVAILVLSTEPETILTLADRIAVMKRGTIVQEFHNQTVTKEDLLAAA
jgi:ribose transport system ATP-binding protein